MTKNFVSIERKNISNYNGRKTFPFSECLQNNSLQDQKIKRIF